MDDTPTDGELIYRALNMWMNYIETGNVVMSAKDLQAATKGDHNLLNHYFYDRRARLKVLDHHQMEMILRLKQLADKALESVNDSDANRSRIRRNKNQNPLRFNC